MKRTVAYFSILSLMVIICCKFSHIFTGMFWLLISICGSRHLFQSCMVCIVYTKEALLSLWKIVFDIVCVWMCVCCSVPGCWQRDLCLPSAWAPGPLPSLPNEVWRFSKRPPQAEERPQWYGHQPKFHNFPLAWTHSKCSNIYLQQDYQVVNLAPPYPANHGRCLIMFIIPLHGNIWSHKLWINPCKYLLAQWKIIFQNLTSYGHVWIIEAGQQRDSICLSYRRANQKQMWLVRSRLLLDLACLYCPHEIEIKIETVQGQGTSTTCVQY